MKQDLECNLECAIVLEWSVTSIKHSVVGERNERKIPLQKWPTLRTKKTYSEKVMTEKGFLNFKWTELEATNKVKNTEKNNWQTCKRNKCYNTTLKRGKKRGETEKKKGGGVSVFIRFSVSKRERINIQANKIIQFLTITHTSMLKDQ